MDHNCERKCDAAAPKQLGTLRSLTSVYLTCGEQILLLYRQGSRVVNNKWISSAGGPGSMTAVRVLSPTARAGAVP